MWAENEISTLTSSMKSETISEIWRGASCALLNQDGCVRENEDTVWCRKRSSQVEAAIVL